MDRSGDGIFARYSDDEYEKIKSIRDYDGAVLFARSMALALYIASENEGAATLLAAKQILTLCACGDTYPSYEKYRETMEVAA